MEEKKTLKIKKPRLIIFALAIAFAIMGFIDLKVNAAELTAPTISEQYLNYTYVSDVQFTNGNTSCLKDIGTLQANPQVRVGIYVQTDDGGALRYCLRYDPALNKETRVSIQRTETYNGSTTTSTRNDLANGVYFYPTSEYKTDSYHAKYTLELDTNIPIFKDITTCINYLNTGVVNEDDLYDVPIDYSQLQTDDTIGTIEKPLMNIIVNEVMEDDLLGNATQKIYEVYNYVVWKNTENLDLQVEIAPFVNVNKGLFDKTFWKQMKGEWESFEIFPGGTTTMTQRSDMYYLEETNSKYIEFLNNVENEYGGLNKECELFFAYRFRYIDISTMRAGKWVYVVPSSNGYTSFTEYLDGTKSSYEKIDGVSVETENVEDVNNIKDNIDLENEFLEKYETTEIDVEDATNWLQSVASFIKGTPSFVGSVMSFLPEPVRYGMFVCLFLGVIASGYAIVKALI